MAADPDCTAEFVEAYAARANAPKASDVERWPACSGEADDSQKRRDQFLAKTFTKTEIMVLNLYQNAHLSQRLGQTLVDMLRHPQFRVEDLQSSTILNFYQNAISKCSLYYIK